MAFTVRTARSADLQGVRRALANSWRVGYDDVLDPERLREHTADLAAFYPAERFERKLDDGRLRFLVAVAGGDVAGAATADWGPNNTHEFVPAGAAQPRSAYVDPAYWRNGAGTALTERALSTLRSLDAPPGELYVEVLADNDRARASTTRSASGTTRTGPWTCTTSHTRRRSSGGRCDPQGTTLRLPCRVRYSDM